MNAMMEMTKIDINALGKAGQSEWQVTSDRCQPIYPRNPWLSGFLVS